MSAAPPLPDQERIVVAGVLLGFMSIYAMAGFGVLCWWTAKPKSSYLAPIAMPPAPPWDEDWED